MKTTTMANLSDLRIDHDTIEINGTSYVVTTGTGECSYGRDLGGGAAFAYDAEDVEDLEQPNDYNDFCEELSPVGEDDPNWLALAVALAVRGERLTIAGACRPALTDREYQIARMAAQG